jgi:arsenate reductase (thioredoxin)
MAEALINTMGAGRFRAYSAGSHPTGKVNPFAIEQVASTRYPINDLRSKCWDEFAQSEAPKMDFILTVCDNAAGEVCPLWPGQPISAHWSFEDPADAVGSDEVKPAAFNKVYRQILGRVQRLVSLPLAEWDRTAIARAMQAIGGTPV